MLLRTVDWNDACACANSWAPWKADRLAPHGSKRRKPVLKLTIFKRLIISYLVIIVLVMASGIYIMVRLNDLNGTIRSMNSVDVQTIRLAGEIAQAVYIQTGFEKKYLISGDRDYRTQFLKMNRHLDQKLTELDNLAVSREMKVLAAKLRASHERYRVMFDGITSAADPTAALRNRDEIITGIEAATRRIAQSADKARNDKLQSLEITSVQVLNAITLSEIAAVLLVLLISFLITRSINSPIRLLQEKTKMTAKGEFGRPLDIASPPEIRELAESFNEMCSRLKELDQMKIDFISHLSHELRTPLTAIKEASSMLMEGVYARSPEKQQELFDIVNGECERLIRSVGRILDLSRMESGMAEFNFEEAEMGPVIEKVAAKLAPIAQRKDIKVYLNLSDGVQPVRMDEEKIEHVIENLLGNALKFTPEEGEISVSLSENDECKRIEVAVSDTGCGIPEESLLEIFEKFKRVDDRKGSVRGSGLGLAIAKHIIKAHGGTIWAESEPGKGSTFIFSLPLSAASS